MTISICIKLLKSKLRDYENKNLRISILSNYWLCKYNAQNMHTLIKMSPDVLSKTVTNGLTKMSFIIPKGLRKNENVVIYSII